MLLSVPRHVLSVDIGVLRSIADDPGDDLDAVIEDLPRLLATASIGGGWSLSPDATTTMGSAGRVQAGEADALMSAHSQVAQVEFRSPEAVGRLIGELEVQLAVATDRLELVEAKVARDPGRVGRALQERRRHHRRLARLSDRPARRPVRRPHRRRTLTGFTYPLPPRGLR